MTNHKSKNNAKQSENKIQKSLEQNIKTLKTAFADCGDVVMREFIVGGETQKMYLIYTDNIVDSNAVREYIMTNLMALYEQETGEMTLKRIELDILAVGETLDLFTYDDVCLAILAGEIVLFMEGEDYALQASLKLFPSRGVNQPQTEVVVQGPKDAFLEVMAINIVLIRRRIRDTKLKLKRKRIGTRTKTDISVMYMEDLVRPQLLAQIESQLDQFQGEGVLDSGSLEQLLEEHYLSPFPQLQMTERPDKASAALLEGRVVVLVDNTPFVILLPTTMNLFFQAAEDYYERWEIMSFVRAIRYVAAFGAMTLPAFFIALAAYHPQLLPVSFAIKVALTRESIPFSVVGEVILMELAFELLREAGIRLPSPISGTIGIVGGIIIGSAAVEAGIVSPLVVIISAVTGVFTFVIPNVAFVSAVRVCKYIIMAFASFFGLFGIWTALTLIGIHLSQMTSYGIPYLYPFCAASANNAKDFEDSVVRFPLRKLKKMSIFMRRHSGGRTGGK